MKVLIVVEPGVDGVFRHVEGLCQYLFSQQVEVHLAYSSLRGSDGLKTLVEAVRNRGGQTLDMRTGNAPCLADMRAFIKLRGLARKVRPDVIHAHSSKAGVLGRTLALAGIKAGFFYTAHAYYGLSGARSRKISFFNWIERPSRMLKKSLFSPAQPRRAETQLSPGGVLASLPGTVKRET